MYVPTQTWTPGSTCMQTQSTQASFCWEWHPQFTFHRPEVWSVWLVSAKSQLGSRSVGASIDGSCSIRGEGGIWSGWSAYILSSHLTGTCIHVHNVWLTTATSLCWFHLTEFSSFGREEGICSRCILMGGKYCHTGMHVPGVNRE